ncbi:hypothetical protein ACLB1M_23970 [Escherichia coli]
MMVVVRNSSDMLLVDPGTGSLPEVKPDPHETRSRRRANAGPRTYAGTDTDPGSQHQNRSQNLFLRKRVILLWAEACG